MNLLQRCIQRNLLPRGSYPQFIENGTLYQAMMGSEAYGIASQSSDIDVYGFCVPPKDVVFPHTAGKIYGFDNFNGFEVWQNHHIEDPDRAKLYDFSIYNLVKYVKLLTDGNPNIIDSLFVPRNCILHSTPVSEQLRQNKHLFLHKGCFYKFTGYMMSQISKLGREPIGKRKELFDKFGYDCYREETTEFLTDSGWKKYSDISDLDKLATVNKQTLSLEYENFSNRIKKDYSGILYTIDANYTKCEITENHNVFVSSFTRKPSNKYTSRYNSTLANWKLKNLKNIVEEIHSDYHVLAGIKSVDRSEYPISDDELRILGLFITEGSFRKKKGQIKSVAISQTTHGQQKILDYLDTISNNFNFKKYTFDKEHSIEYTYATFNHRIVDLCKLCGKTSRNKKLPDFFRQLSNRQMKILWEYLILGDGTINKNGEVLYTSSCQLANELQELLLISGFLSSCRGPYIYPEYPLQPGFTQHCPIYQVYKPNDGDIYKSVSLSNKIKKHVKGGLNLKQEEVENCSVVCFEVPNNTLITRNHGRIAIQGNCKYASHAVRLGLQIEQVLTEGTLELDRNREILKSIRKGEWTEQDVKSWVHSKERDLQTAYTNSKLPNKPDIDRIRQLLIDMLEHHFGSVALVERLDKYEQAFKQIAEIVHKNG